jgi:COG4 transport protein
LPPAQTLQDARTHLLQVFTRQFTEATKARDAVATTRFFKLFPVIGLETEGLEAYASFIVDLVKVRPPASAQRAFSRERLHRWLARRLNDYSMQRLPRSTTSPL